MHDFMPTSGEMMAEHENVTADMLRGEITAAVQAGSITVGESHMPLMLLETAEYNRTQQTPDSPFVEAFSVQTVRRCLEDLLRR